MTRRLDSTPFLVHSALTVLLGGFFIAINLLTDRSTFWAIWPIWVLLVFLGAHAGLRILRGHPVLGVWIGGGAMLCTGLLGIDLANSGNAWWYWPAGAWLLLSVLFTGLSVDLLSTIPTQQSRQDDEF
jgi:hypothetical protein